LCARGKGRVDFVLVKYARCDFESLPDFSKLMKLMIKSVPGAQFVSYAINDFFFLLFECVCTRFIRKGEEGKANSNGLNNLSQTIKVPP